MFDYFFVVVVFNFAVMERMVVVVSMVLSPVLGFRSLFSFFLFFSPSPLSELMVANGEER